MRPIGQIACERVHTSEMNDGNLNLIAVVRSVGALDTRSSANPPPLSGYLREDIDRVYAADWLRRLDVKSVPAAAEGRSFVIPCCYEFGPDLERVAEHTKLAPADVIARHAA